MDNDRPDNNSGEVLNKGKERAPEGAFSGLKLRPLVDESHKILDPLYIQPNSGNTEDEILFKFSETKWGNDKPIKFHRNAEVIFGTPCDPLGTTTVQTSDKIAGHNVSGIEKPSRGRFITFTADGLDRITVELKNMNGRTIAQSYCIKGNESTGNFDEISKHLLGESYPPVPFADLPENVDTLFNKRLDRHDELTLEELQSCIFDPKTTMLEGGAYKFGCVLDGDKGRMVYGRSMASAGGKLLRPHLYHDHLTGNMEVLGAAGTFGIMPKGNVATHCDNNSSGYDFPPSDDVKQCFNGLIDEGALVFSSLNLDAAPLQAGKILSFRRPPGSRSASKRSSMASMRSAAGNPPTPTTDYFSKPPAKRQESGSSDMSSKTSPLASSTPLSLGGAESSRAQEASESPQQSPPPESPTMPEPLIEGKFPSRKRRPLLRKITGSFQDLGLGKVSEVSVEAGQKRQSGDRPGRSKSPAQNREAEGEGIGETSAALRTIDSEDVPDSSPKSSILNCDILRNAFVGKPRETWENLKGKVKGVKADFKNRLHRTR